MRWITHTSVTVAAGLLFHPSVPFTAGLAAGSVLPDVVDRVLSGGNQQIWRRIHRGSSHWLGWYVLLAAVSFTVGPDMNEGVRGLFMQLKGILPREVMRELGRALQNGPMDSILLGLGLGGIAHIALDALNPSGVPLLPFSMKPRFGLGLVSTGTFGEYVFLGISLLLLGGKGVEAFL